MKLQNVKIGLRVQMKSTDNHVPAGTLGTVTQIMGEAVCVHWDDNVGGWGDPDYNTPSGHGWAVPVEDIRKFEGESDCKLKDVKVGQRVELKAPCSSSAIQVGSKGTIVEDHVEFPFVEWDNYGKYAVYRERLRKIKGESK